MTKPARFRKKPVVIEAMKVLRENLTEVRKWVGVAPLYDRDYEAVYLIIPTLEGDHRANEGDWIVKGIKGEFYPCKPDIFEATYEPVD